MCDTARTPEVPMMHVSGYVPAPLRANNPILPISGWRPNASDRILMRAIVSWPDTEGDDTEGENLNFVESPPFLAEYGVFIFRGIPPGRTITFHVAQENNIKCSAQTSFKTVCGPGKCCSVLATAA